MAVAVANTVYGPARRLLCVDPLSKPLVCCGLVMRFTAVHPYIGDSIAVYTVCELAQGIIAARVVL
jgi:hypothetical protein